MGDSRDLSTACRDSSGEEDCDDALTSGVRSVASSISVGSDDSERVSSVVSSSFTGGRRAGINRVMVGINKDLNNGFSSDEQIRGWVEENVPSQLSDDQIDKYI